MNFLKNAILAEIGNDDMIEWIISDLIEDSENYLDTDAMKNKIIALYKKCDDVINRGCISGCVSSLIYYSDTNRFYEKFNDEIYDYFDNEGWEAINDNMEASDFVKFENGAKCKVVWIVYEEITYMIHEMLYDEFDFLK